jgi:hypothetical protein
VVARTRVARTRLTPDEYETFAAEAEEAGINPAEYLRDLIVGRSAKGSLISRVQRLEQRLEHFEEQLSEIWLEVKRGRSS